MVAALYDIGQKVPDFMTDFPDVFLKACNDTYKDVSGLAKVRERMALLTSMEGVDAFNEVFWDQSLAVQVMLLRQIQRDGLINAETAEVVMEMAAECMKHRKRQYTLNRIDDVLLTVSRIGCLSSNLLRTLVNVAKRLPNFCVKTIVYEQPLDRLLEYFWVTDDQRVVPAVAQQFVLASVTYKSVQGGKSIVSIVERGKKTEQEVPTKSVKKLIRLVKAELRKFYGDLFSETWYSFMWSSLESMKLKLKLKKKPF